MKKIEIIKNIAEKSDIKKQDITYVIESFMTEIKDSLIKGENIYLRGFGTFVVKERKEKKARLIRKKETITVPAHKIPTFKVCKSLKNEVSKNNPC